MVKIDSVTAEILLIWTNVARTNVAWRNVNLIVEICSRCSQEVTVIFVSNPTTVEVVLRLSWGFYNKTNYNNLIGESKSEVFFNIPFHHTGSENTTEKPMCAILCPFMFNVCL